jgi:hypothetical protein
LRDVLESDFTAELLVDAYRGATRTLEGLSPVAWSLSFNGEAAIPSGGSMTVAAESTAGRSLVPVRASDPLAPFGQELNVSLRVSADAFSEVVRLGWFRIVAVPGTRDGSFDFGGRQVAPTSVVELTLLDRLVGVQRWGFPSEQSPPSLDSCWAEMQRLSGMQLDRSVPDKGIPSTVVYEASKGGRLKGVQELAEVLGGVPYVTAAGALSVAPTTVGAPVGRLRSVGDRATVLQLSSSMESEDVSNEVIGDFETPDRDPIHAEARLYEGPLSVFGPLGTNTKYLRATDFPYVTTQRQAEDTVNAELRRASTVRTYRVKADCIINPLVEFGDTWELEMENGTVLPGRVVSVGFSDGFQMSVELEVSGAV